MSVHDVTQICLDFFETEVVIEPVEEQLSSDSGLLLFRQFDQRLGFTTGFTEQLGDGRRNPSHTLLEMVRSRVYGILAGYEDQNDHDTLRSDPVLKLIAGRQPNDDHLASQPTLSRFENSITPAMLLRLENWFLQRFVDSFQEPPREVTLDIDVFDDPTHGEQQLTFFHGYYRQYQYLVRVITCAENDLVVLPVLLHGVAHPSLGAPADLARVVQALRAKFPDVRIHVRADSGYGVPAMYEVCERLQVDYSIGIGMNPVLQRNSDDVLQQAVGQYAASGQPQRWFTGFSYEARSWSAPRWVVVKCEVNARGTNRRAVVTNRPGAQVLPGAAYDEYVDRGESENRNKELKCELKADRLSDHRYMANAFRMFLHVAAHNLLVRLRRLVAAPPVEPQPAELPAEALTGRARRARFNRRRQADPLGEGHACTWQLMLIKVASRIKTTARRVRVFLSQSWPHLSYFRQVAQALLPAT